MSQSVTVSALGSSVARLSGASGSVVKLTPSGTAYVEYTQSGEAAINNGTAIWSIWPKGTVTITVSDTMLQPAAVRVVCTSGSATLSISPGGAAAVNDADLVWLNQRRKNTRKAADSAVLIGDSIAANFYSTAATAAAYTDIGFMGWGNALMGWRLNILNPSAALGGTTSRDWVGRIESQVLPYRPGWVVCYLGTNDISSDIPYAESVGNLQSIFDQLIGAGIQVVVCTVIPYGSGNALLTAARNVARNKLNDWITRYCSETPGAVLCDMHKIVIDPASAVGAARANYLWDDLHPSALGARAMGAGLASVMSAYTTDSQQHVNAFTDNYAYDATASNKVSNPLFNSSTGTAGASSAGAGTTITATSIARDWTVATVAGGTSTTVCTTPAAADGIGNAQRTVISGTNATDQITVRTGSIASARLATGDVLYGECFVSLASCTALEGIRLTWSYLVDGVTYTYSCLSPQIKQFDQSDVTQLVLRTPTFTVPPGTLTSGQLSINYFFDGAGGATAEVWRMALRKVN